MDSTNPNLVIASNLYRASAFLSAIDYFIYEPRSGFLVVFLTLVVLILISRVIRKGFKWVKWALLVISGISMPFVVIGLSGLFRNHILYGVVSVVINLLQILAVVYLFRPFEEAEITTVSNSSDD